MTWRRGVAAPGALARSERLVVLRCVSRLALPQVGPLVAAPAARARRGGGGAGGGGGGGGGREPRRCRRALSSSLLLVWLQQPVGALLARQRSRLALALLVALRVRKEGVRERGTERGERASTAATCTPGARLVSLFAGRAAEQVCSEGARLAAVGQTLWSRAAQRQASRANALTRHTTAHLLYQLRCQRGRANSFLACTPHHTMPRQVATSSTQHLSLINPRVPSPRSLTHPGR